MEKIIYATTQFDPGDADPNAYAEYELIVYEPGLPMHLPCQLHHHALVGLHGWWCQGEEGPTPSA